VLGAGECALVQRILDIFASMKQPTNCVCRVLLLLLLLSFVVVVFFVAGSAGRHQLHLSAATRTNRYRDDICFSKSASTLWGKCFAV
jgi:hypothetical protein